MDISTYLVAKTCLTALERQKLSDWLNSKEYIHCFDNDDYYVIASFVDIKNQLPEYAILIYGVIPLRIRLGEEIG